MKKLIAIMLQVQEMQSMHMIPHSTLKVQHSKTIQMPFSASLLKNTI